MGNFNKMKKIKICLFIVLFIILLTLLAFVLGIVIKTAVFQPPQSYGSGLLLPNIENLPSKRNTSNYLVNLREAIKLRTISYDNGSSVSENQFFKLHNLIHKKFPVIHSSSFIKLSKVNTLSLLYEISGTKSSLEPALFVSHLDIVPTDGQKWKMEPFSAQLKDGFIYGRGSIDNKPVVFAMLEALEYLISQNQRPERSILICFGHDEEHPVELVRSIRRLSNCHSFLERKNETPDHQSRGRELFQIHDPIFYIDDFTESFDEAFLQIGGFNGAQKVAQALISKGYTKLRFVLDEGTPIVSSMMGVNRPVAMLSVAEKGYLTLEFSVEYQGGHSSMPHKEGAISVLSEAMVRLKSNPHPACLAEDDIFTVALQKLAPYMTWWNKMAIANINLFRSVVIKYMSKEASIDAILRTTTAITQFHSGNKNNVLPEKAKAIVNHRVHPSVTLQEAIKYDQTVISDDRVKVQTIQAVDPTRIAPFLSDEALVYSLLEKTLQMMDSDIVVIPGLLVGNTDSRWFKNLTDKIYKITPIQMAQEDISGYHGSNERVAVKSYLKLIDFYYRLIKYVDVLPDLA